MVGLGRLELPTPCLSGTYSNQLSYRPASSRAPDTATGDCSPDASVSQRLVAAYSTRYLVTHPEGCSQGLLKGGDPAAGSPTATLLRLHPNHRTDRWRLPPCGWLNDFRSIQLSWCDGRCVQGPGTYSPRHSDPRLLAIPTSRSRVADCDPN